METYLKPLQHFLKEQCNIFYSYSLMAIGWREQLSLATAASLDHTKQSISLEFFYFQLLFLC